MADTKPRAVRVPDELWDAALAASEITGRTITSVIIEALEQFSSIVPAPHQELVP
jgi:predicted DNA-binding protein